MEDEGRTDVDDILCHIEQDIPHTLEDVLRERSVHIILSVQFNSLNLVPSIDWSPFLCLEERRKSMLDEMKIMKDHFLKSIQLIRDYSFHRELPELSSDNTTDSQEMIESHFKEWEHDRENLVTLLWEYSAEGDRNSTIGSCFRIIVSSADIFSNFLRLLYSSFSPSMDFAMEQFSMLGLWSHITELALTKKKMADVMKIMEKDKENYEKITEWFEHTYEVDEAMNNIFPYAINDALMKKIEVSFGHLDECDRIFLAVVASNWMHDATLLDNREFLRNAKMFSKSAVATRWFKRYFQRNILQMWKCYDSQELLRSVFGTSSEKYSDILIEACKILSSQREAKILYSFMTILLEGSNLLYKNSSSSHEMRLVAGIAEKELEEMRKLFCSLSANTE